MSGVATAGGTAAAGRAAPVPAGRRRHPAGRPGRRHRRPAGRVTAFAAATVWLVVVLAPLYYMVLASLRSQGSYLTANPWLPAGGLSFANYGTVFTAGLGRYLLNSVIVTAG